jgi:hypothetical protein
MDVLQHATLSSLNLRRRQEEKVWKVKMESDGRTIDVTTDLAKFLEIKEIVPVDAQGGNDQDSQGDSDEGSLE